MNRKGLQKTADLEPEGVFDLGFGSEIYWVSYVVNGETGKTPMCPNCPDLFWATLKRRHRINKIKTFEYEIIKQVGKSQYY